MSNLTILDRAARTGTVAKKWISKATSGAHGQFAAKAKKAGMSTREFAAKHSGDSGVLGKQARLAKTLMSMHHGPRKSKRESLYSHSRD